MAQTAWDYEAPYRALSDADKRKVETLHGLVRDFQRAQNRALARSVGLTEGRPEGWKFL